MREYIKFHFRFDGKKIIGFHVDKIVFHDSKSYNSDAVCKGIAIELNKYKEKLEEGLNTLKETRTTIRKKTDTEINEVRYQGIFFNIIFKDELGVVIDFKINLMEVKEENGNFIIPISWPTK